MTATPESEGQAGRGGAGGTRHTRGTGGRVAWAVFDWANSAFPTIIITFVFATYFTQAVAVDPVSGASQWGVAISLSALAIALTSPLLGALADAGGRRKPWLGGLTLLMTAATAGLWFIEPEPRFALAALLLVAVANFAFEVGIVFYNAMLLPITPPGRLGRWSGWAWGLGYAGGLACLVIALFGLVQAEPAPFGLDDHAAGPVRATALLVAAWVAVFAVPLFIWTPDGTARIRQPGRIIGRAFRELVETVRQARRYSAIGRFLIARLVYIDGLNTIFAFGGIYAAGTFGLSLEQVLLFGIVINVTAGIGAAAMAWLDDRLGPKRVIVVSLAAMIGLGLPLLLTTDITMFWILGTALGLFFGPVQSASRSAMARLAPVGMQGEMFGLFALSGKITAFVGPLLFAWLSVMFDSQRAGMAGAVALVAVGLILLLPQRLPGGRDPG
ncbi:MAG: MFS transporter [Alphaproteobacteria bacterium]